MRVDQAAITEIERQQLIAILETALAMLKGPMVEPGLLKRLGDSAKSTAKKTIEKQAERAMGAGLESLAEALMSLLSKLG